MNIYTNRVWGKRWNFNQFCNISVRKLAMIVDEKMEHIAATVFYLCSKTFNWEDINSRIVKNHCPYSGKYWHLAHWICTMEYKELIYIPVLAHNSFRHDNHLILPRTVEKINKWLFRCWWKHWKVYLFHSEKGLRIKF